MISKMIDTIKYPAFALKDVPYKVYYNDTSIVITKQPDGKEYMFDIMVDNVNSYVERLFYMEEEVENRIQFDYTILNREQLVFSYENIEWCVDSDGKIFNLGHKQNLPVECRKVKTVKEDKIWLEKVLHSFELKVPLEESNIDELWATIVMINNEWFIKNFSYEYKKYSNYLII
jgi:hypothetical protein